MTTPNPQLKLRAEKSETILYGVPLKLFALAFLFAAFVSVMGVVHLGWLFGGIIGSIFSVAVFAPLRWAHQNDTRAWEYWFDALFSHPTKEKIIKKRLFLLSGGEVLSYQQWKQKHENTARVD